MTGAGAFEKDDGIPVSEINVGSGRSARDWVQARGGVLKNGRVFGLDELPLGT
jgi:hypothetical protein